MWPALPVLIDEYGSTLVRTYKIVPSQLSCSWMHQRAVRPACLNMQMLPHVLDFLPLMVDDLICKA